MNRFQRPVGWRNESYRHYLASKGVKTRQYMRSKWKSVVPGSTTADLMMAKYPGVTPAGSVTSEEGNPYENVAGMDEWMKDFGARRAASKTGLDLKRYGEYMDEEGDEYEGLPKRRRIPDDGRGKWTPDDDDEYPDYDADEWEYRAKEDERRREYGLSSREDDRMWGTGGSSIMKEDKEEGIALISHYANDDPTVFPTTFEIRRRGGEVLWESGPTHVAEYLAEGGYYEMPKILRQQALNEFKKRVQRSARVNPLNVERATTGFKRIFPARKMR